MTWSTQNGECVSASGSPKVATDYDSMTGVNTIAACMAHCELNSYCYGFH